MTKHWYSESEKQQVAELAQQGLTVLDIVLKTDIPESKVRKIAWCENIDVRGGFSEFAKRTSGMSLEQKIKLLFEARPDKDYSVSELTNLAGLRPYSGIGNSVREIVDRMVSSGVVDKYVGSHRTYRYYLAGHKVPEQPSTKTMDFKKCDDLEEIKCLLAEILEVLKSK